MFAQGPKKPSRGGRGKEKASPGVEIGHHHFAVQAAPAVFPVYAALPEEPSAFLAQLDQAVLLDCRYVFG